jgi:hypothetical protein
MTRTVEGILNAQVTPPTSELENWRNDATGHSIEAWISLNPADLSRSDGDRLRVVSG